jgi:glutaredoxin 3
MIEVYGKPDCNYCTKAKDLLNSKLVAFDYYSVGEDVTTEEVIERFPNARSVPVVVVNGNHIGGYEELRTLIEEKQNALGI